jgi:hypothetical protein
MNAIDHAHAMQPSTLHKLRQTGRRMVSFEGWQIVEATGGQLSSPVWHELNLYQTVDEKVVVELKTRFQLPEDHDRACVRTFHDLEAAAGWLIQYEAAGDVPLPVTLTIADRSLAWVALASVHLRQLMEKVDLDYKSLLSEVFLALDLSEPAGVAAAT